jgi:hemoglobin
MSEPRDNTSMTDGATLADIVRPADIDKLVAAFYGRLLSDPILGFIFTDIAAIDLPEHLPKISAFWQQQLLGIPGYRGQTFALHSDLHRRIALTAEHFHRWLFLFDESIDALFRGPIANAAKNRAGNIAASMQQALAQRYRSDLELNPLTGVNYQMPESRE